MDMNSDNRGAPNDHETDGEYDSGPGDTSKRLKAMTKLLEWKTKQ